GTLIALDEPDAAADPLVELSGIRAERHATVDDYTEVAPPVTERLKPATVHRMMAGHALEEREDRRWHPEQESHVLFRRELRDAVDPLFPVEDRRENFTRQAPLPDQWRQPAKHERGEIANEARGANRLQRGAAAQHHHGATEELAGAPALDPQHQRVRGCLAR